MKINVKEHFNKPCVMALIGNVNEAKSNLAYHLIEELNNEFDFNLYVYGFRNEIKGAHEIYSLNELENIRDSVIFLDEFAGLIDLEDRKNKAQVEQTLRLLFHKNNILVLIGLPQNFNKFVSGKIGTVFYKKVTFEDFIRGSNVKKNIINYMGAEKGSTVLNINKDEVIVYNGSGYKKHTVPYLVDFDSKKDNVNIFTKKSYCPAEREVSEKVTVEDLK